MIVGSQQVIPSIINPVNHVICYDADLWDWSCKVKNHITYYTGKDMKIFLGRYTTQE